MKRLPPLLKTVTLTLLLGGSPLFSPAVVAQSGGSATLLYTVKAGDTLYRIATERGLKPEDLLRINGLATPTLSVGQTLKLPSGTSGSAPAASSAAAPAPTPPAATQKPSPAPKPVQSASPAPDAPASSAFGSNVIAGVTVRAPARLKMGDGFVLRLSGEKAGEAVVSFPSEVGEDVRKPAEPLTPIGAAGEFQVLGRVVLGKTTPLVYTVKVGTDVLRGSIPVSGLDQPIQHLTLAKSLTDRLTAPSRPLEEKVVEAAYALRTPQAWSRPFAAPLTTKSVSSSFGQPRTYLAGGPVLYHYGMDFPAPVGTSVRAVNDGRVVIAATYPVRGGLVAIDHGAGLVSLYFHQSKLLVKVGQRVTRGQIVGQVGTTGLSAGPHLHLEMRVRGEATLPTEYFNRLWP
ncbi:peptidoglycan DD-metalloendopeptidase family protein [Deinococcus altitudinis]|uniref:LysM peptidoglycan-binding domain-containing M23 family metallopeptidase n=1 Tax=Deinococcus altitudinis TaxID=468914 RepID=UPI00389191A1